MQKITPEMFGAWMKILERTNGSVLWLLGNTDDTKARIKKAAEQAGIDPDRILYAEKKANPDHLARYPLADLFLDTFPYGAHTTAADAMWMGVPILTIAGRGFAACVCASLVSAAGLPEMICPSVEAYVGKAVQLAGDRTALDAARQKLVSARATSLLFDTGTLTRNLERLYRQMWTDYEANALPVPDLRNLDVYCEVGAALNLIGVAALPDDAYLARYRQALSRQHQTYPIAADARIWRDPR
jgi:predicted O-linked N-acetylglucosamine transferase (SPINDLY family)